jgi:hypothetical protein
MYKARLAKWGFQKHVRRQDAFHMVRTARRRAAADGKRTVFQARESSATTTLAPANVDRYLKRKYRSDSDFLAALMVESQKKYAVEAARLEYTTPPCVQSPSPPLGQALPLEILQSLHYYFDTSFSGNLWMKRNVTVDVCSTLPKGTDMLGLKSLYSAHDLACELLDTDRAGEAGVVLRRASAGFRDLVTAQHPRMLTALFDLFVHLIGRRRPEVAIILLRQFSSLTSILLGAEHPVSQALDRLLRASRLDFQPYLLLAWQSAVASFEDALGPLHYSTLRVRLEYIQVGIGLDDLILAERQIRELAERCERELGAEDLRTLKLFDTLADVLFELDRGDECVVIGEKIVRAAITFVLNDYDRFVDLTCSGLFTVARALRHRAVREQSSLQHKVEAVEKLWQAIDLCILHRGVQHPLSMKYLVCLEDWAAAWGDEGLRIAAQCRRVEGLSLR